MIAFISFIFKQTALNVKCEEPIVILLVIIIISSEIDHLKYEY